MFEKGEISTLIFAGLIMSVVISFSSSNRGISLVEIPVAILISLIILAVAIFSKRFTAKKIDTKINFSFWKWQRYWFSKGSYLKKPFSIGVLLSLLLLVLSVGKIKFLALLQFDTKALVSKVVKQYGKKRFSTVTEWDKALISFYGLIAILLLAVITKFIPQTIFPFKELAKYSAFYAICNMIPIGDLDGAKIFFGSRPLYIFSLILTIIACLIALI
jgi:hypothetical protein